MSRTGCFLLWHSPAQQTYQMYLSHLRGLCCWAVVFKLLFMFWSAGTPGFLKKMPSYIDTQSIKNGLWWKCWGWCLVGAQSLPAQCWGLRPSIYRSLWQTQNSVEKFLAEWKEHRCHHLLDVWVWASNTLVLSFVIFKIGIIPTSRGGCKD